MHADVLGDASPHIAIATTTLDGRLQSCNAQFEQLCGLPKGVLLQKSIFALTHQDYLAQVRAARGWFGPPPPLCGWMVLADSP